MTLTNNGGDCTDLLAGLAEHFWRQRADRIDRLTRQIDPAWVDQWAVRIWATKAVDG